MQTRTQRTFLSSTSKISVEFAGIAGGDPFCPYLKHELYIITHLNYTLETVFLYLEQK